MTTERLRTRTLRDDTPAVDDPVALRRRAMRSGYLFLRGVVDSGAVAALRDEVLALCADVGWLDERSPPGAAVARRGLCLDAYRSEWLSVQHRIVGSPAFARLRADRAVVRALGLIYGAAPRHGYGDCCRAFSPGTAAASTPPHQDSFYVPESDGLWVAWVPLVECPRTLGGLAVLPGSHRGGVRPHEGDGSGRPGLAVPAGAGWATAHFRPGDVVLFDGRTVHRALHNVTADRLRLSADFRYRPAPPA